MRNWLVGLLVVSLIGIGALAIFGSGCAEVAQVPTTTTIPSGSTTTTTLYSGPSTTTTSTTTTTLPKASSPVFTLAAGDLDTTEATVTIEAGATGADTIYYTTDGSTPTTASTLYSSSFAITASKNIKAIAAKSGYQNSDVGSVQYNLWWWSAMDGLNDYVNAIASGSIYAGGRDFGTVDGQANTYVAKWNGSSWTSICNAANNMNSIVNALAIDSSGNLYVGFESNVSAEGETDTYLAKWDGNTWTSLCNQTNKMNAVVNVLVFDSSGNLYVGFNGSVSVEAETSTYIAKWDGNNWTSIGNASNDMDYEVNALVFDSPGNLYAGLANSTILDGQSGTYIAKWNGSTWSTVGNASNGMDQIIDSLTVDSSNNLYAGMDGSSTVGGVVTTYLGKWNGSSWTSLGNQANGIDSNVNAIIRTSSGTLYAGGGSFDAGTYNYCKRYTGSTWEVFGGGINNEVLAAYIDSSDNLYFGGSFADGDIPNVTGENYIIKWGKIE